MKAIARDRSHSIEFKRQIAQEFMAGATLYGLSKRHNLSRQLIRLWVQRYEAGSLDEDAQAADLLQEYETKIDSMRSMTGDPYNSQFVLSLFRYAIDIGPTVCGPANAGEWDASNCAKTLRKVSQSAA
jgi:transposase-like protein